MTPAKSFRLSAQAVADMEALAAHWGCKSNATALEMALREAARKHLKLPDDPKTAKRKGKKHA